MQTNALETGAALSGVSLVAAAASFAAIAHGATFRKGLNEPYILHPLRVGEMAARLGASPELIAAAYLHDVVEDTDLELDDLSAFPDRVVKLVSLLTKAQPAANTKDAEAVAKCKYYMLIEGDADAVFLKVLDRVDNVRDMVRTHSQNPTMRKWAEKYLAKTIREFRTMSFSAPFEARELYNEALAQLSEALAKDGV
jgi:GTP pyrophosphokinase